MSITSEITRLKNAKTSLKTAINNKLGTSTKIANEKIDQYATFVNNITTGTGANLNDYFLTEISSSYFDARKLIKKLPQVTVSPNCTSLKVAFSDFINLETLDLSNFDTSNVTNMNNAFSNCLSLNTLNITGWNFQNVNYIANILINCTNLTTIIGTFQNLGQAYSTTEQANYYQYTLSLSLCTKLTEQSLINILSGLYDIKTKGCNQQSIILGETNLAKLTSTEGQNALAQAQSYGWTVS